MVVGEDGESCEEVEAMVEIVDEINSQSGRQDSTDHQKLNCVNLRWDGGEERESRTRVINALDNLPAESESRLVETEGHDDCESDLLDVMSAHG